VLPDLAGACVRPEVATEVVAVAFPEVLVADAVKVVAVTRPSDVDLTFVDKIL
jgi:hypothetical protein